MNRSTILAVVATAVLTAVAVGGGVALATHDSGSLHACARNKDGRMRLVDSADDCKRKETAVEWGIQGPQGEAGPQGPLGSTAPDCELELRIRATSTQFQVAPECDAALPVIELVTINSSFVADSDVDGVLDSVRCQPIADQDVLRVEFVIENTSGVAAVADLGVFGNGATVIYQFVDEADSTDLNQPLAIGPGQTVAVVAYVRGYEGLSASLGLYDATLFAVVYDGFSEHGGPGVWEHQFQVEVTSQC